MTVASETNRSGPYTGNGVTTVFDYQFRIVSENHVKVIRADLAGVESVLIIDADYVVSDVGNPAGGQVALTAPLTTGYTLTLLRNVPFTQETDLQNQGAYYAETVEAALDLAVMRDQELKEKVDRTIYSGPGSSGYEFPEAEADTVIGWNTAGDKLENKSLMSFGLAVISTLMRTVLALATYAEAWLVLKLNGSLSTRALIKALAPQDGMSVLLTEPGRVGNFIWRLGDYSAQVAMDTSEGIYLKADSVAATVGAWVRDFEILNVEHFGAAATATRTANRIAIQCAINVAQAYVGGLMVRDTYLTDGAVTQTAAMQFWGYHADKSKISSNSGPAISLVPSAGISTDNTWWGWRNFSAITTDAVHWAMEYVSSGTEYMSNWIMEGVKADGPQGGVSFDSSGSTVGIFSCTMRRNWWANGSLFKDIGDSVHILENTINGNGIGILVNGVKGGAQQLVIADNNITTRSECVYLLNVSAAHIDRNWMETPSYLGSYTGTTGALLYAQGCPNARIERNTIQPLNAAMVGLGQTAAAYSIRLNTSGDQSIIEGNRLIAIGNTGHIQIGAGVTNTYIKEDNKFDAAPIITDAGTGTFGAGNTPGVYNQLVAFKTSAQFASVISMECTNAGTGNGPYGDIYRNNASQANQGLGGWLWYGNNSIGVKTNIAYMTATMVDNVSGTEDGRITFARMLAGALVVGLTIDTIATFTMGGVFTGVVAPSVGATYSLGNSTQTWLNLFMATGSVINFANGNYTITHSAGTLTLSGILVASSYKVGANQVVGARDTGWTAMTGTGSKAALAAAAAGTASAAYVQAELQAALNRIAALEARLRSLDAALVTHGLIGP